MKKESKRQQQVAEVIKRNFSRVLQQEGGYIYGHGVMVTVTSVKMTPDFGMAKIYLSVFNTENKQAVILQMEEAHHRLKQVLASFIRKKVRRMPEISFYMDETLDEMYRLNDMFKKLKEDNQMGSEEAS